MRNKKQPDVAQELIPLHHAPVQTMAAELIAPCGLNCRLCYGYQRKKNKCTGCRSEASDKPSYCVTCIIKNCAHNQTGSMLCFDCEKLPCKRMKDLDKRYRTKYHVSLLQNLQYIRDNGMAAFLIWERQRWTCPDCGQIVSMHKQTCDTCGRPVVPNETPS